MGAAFLVNRYDNVFIGSADAPPTLNIIYTTVLFVLLDVTYTAFDIPMGALAFSITPNGIERTKLFGVSSIVRSVLGALPQVFVAGAAWLPFSETILLRRISPLRLFRQSVFSF